MTLKTWINRYKYCTIGMAVFLSCAMVEIFGLHGIIFGLIILALCYTFQFLIIDKGQKQPAEDKINNIVDKNLFHKVMNIVPGVVYVSMFDGSVIFISDGIEKLLGYKPEEIGKTRNFLFQQIHPEDREMVSKQIKKLQSGNAATIEYRLQKKDGTYICVSDCLNTIKNDWGNITHYNGVLANIDEKRKYDKDLQNLNARIHQLNNAVNQHAVRDSLTNVYNKRYSLVILQNEFNRARTQNKPLSCMLLDIDHLESINSRYGYFLGNRILTEVAKCIQRHIRPIDVVSRFGDDEFLVILSEVEKEELDSISNMLESEVGRCCIKDEEKNVNIDFKVTIGKCSVAPAIKTISDLIEQTTRSLFAAKAAKNVYKE